MNPVGISSGSCAELSAPALAALAEELKAEVVDLRAGKGHGWERDGIAPLRDAAIRVAFVGLSIVLGRPDQACGDQLAYRDRLGGTGLPVKVFATAGLGTDRDARLLAYRQVQELRKGGSVLVETHHGYADRSALARLCVDTGCGLLVDTLGLAKLSGSLTGTTAEFRGHITAGQVKGYDVADPGGTRHLPLSAMDATHAAQLRALVPPGAPVLIESKAGVLADDLAVLRDWLSHRDEEENNA